MLRWYFDVQYNTDIGAQTSSETCESTQTSVGPHNSRIAAARWTPIEAKFQAQDDKLDSLRTGLTKLQAQQDAQQQDMKDEFLQAETHEQTNMKKVEASLRQLKQDMDKSLAQTLQIHTQAMGRQFLELKALSTSASKRAKPAIDEEDMSDG